MGALIEAPVILSIIKTNNVPNIIIYYNIIVSVIKGIFKKLNKW